MKLTYRLAVSCVFAATSVFAEEPAALKPMLVKPQDLAFEARFDAALANPWRVAKGNWEPQDGVLVGKELAADKHAAVLNCQVPNRNSAIQFSFQLDGAKSFNLSLNHSKGHLFRVIIQPDAAVLQKDKDKKDPNSKSVELARTEGKFEQGKWYTALVEMQGDQVVAQFDNGVTVKAADPALDVDKPNYRFVMRGESLKLDNIKIWKTASEK